MSDRISGFIWNHSPGMRWLSNRLQNAFHHDGNTGVMPPGPSSYPVAQVPGMTQGPLPGAGTSGAYTDPNVDPSQPQGNPGAPNPTSTYGGFTGNSSGGTLGGGYGVDPSSWGQFGLGGTGAGDSTGYYSQFMTKKGEGRGFGNTVTLDQLHQAVAAQHMHTGGNDPAHGYDSSGINPDGMYTGGNLPPQQAPTMQTGGALPPMRLARTGGQGAGPGYPGRLGLPR